MFWRLCLKKHLLKKYFLSLDYFLIALVMILCTSGLFLIYSATLSSGNSRRVSVQLLSAILGIIIMFCLSILDYRIYEYCEKYIYYASIAVLVIVLIFGSGKEKTGANSWIRFFGIGIQPSELVKISFAVIFGYRLSEAKKTDILNNPKCVLKLFLFYISITIFVIMQNDTGTALVFTFMFVTMFFVAGLSYKYILTASFILIPILPLSWFLMAPYQRNRISVFFNPELDPLNSGYQVLQSKIAVGSGGISGRGYLNGPQNRLGLLPEKETDFIFGVIGEEFGFLGCCAIVLMLFILCFRIFYIARRIKDETGSLICIGLGSIFLFHTIENVCMCIGILPVTGIPLPFLSYGGSSLVTSFAAIGIILNIKRVSNELSFYKQFTHRKDF